MSLADCIQRAIDDPDPQSRLDPERGKQLIEMIRDLEQQYGHLGKDAAAAQAAIDARAALKRETERSKRLKLKQVATAQRLWQQVSEYRNLAGEADASGALPALLEWDQAGRFPSVTSIRSALRGRYHRMIGDVLRRHGRDVLGRVRNKADLPNIVRELHGVKTGDAAASELAGAVRAAMEQARRDFNAAGGDIGRLDDWGLPHSHDADLIRRAGFDAWAQAIAPRLDWERIRDFETGRPMAELGQSRRIAFLRSIHEDIVTDGWAKMQPSFRAAGRSVANRRADHRVLHFAGADAWLAYNETFGRSDPFATIVTHLDGMARDTALMQVLGPSPAAGLEFARQAAVKLAHERGGSTGRLSIYSSPATKAEGRGKLARNMLAQLTDEATRPGADKIAAWLLGARHWLVSAKLGSAMLSATTDVGFQKRAANHIGMGAGRVIARQARLLASEGARTQALRSGVIADQLANVGVAQARFMGEAYGPEVAERLSELTMRLSGITAWTEAGRHAFQLETMGFLADHAARGWDELPDPLRRLFLEAHGIDAREWDVIRSTPLHRDESGATFLYPDDIRGREDLDPAAADALALKLMGAISDETEFAVPSTSLRGRAIMLGETQPGTFPGELLRSGLMFKSFALSMIFSQLRRVFLAPVNGTRAGQIASFFAMTTLMGAAALQLKEVARGNDPRPMGSAKFIAAAVAQGGGLGILGDFAFSGQNRFGGGPAATLAGPLVGTVADTLMWGNEAVEGLADGKDLSARRIIRGVQLNLPLQSLWYANLALRRLGFDQLTLALDPEAADAFARAERNRVRDYGNAAWWGPGQPAPRRAPDLTSAFGESP